MTDRIELPEPPFDSYAAGHLTAMFGDRKPLALFRAMARTERSWEKFRGGSMLDTRLVTLREREIVIDRTCARTRCEWEWGVHIMAFADKAGFDRQQIAETLRMPPDPSKWTASEIALIRAVDALHDRSTLSDAEFAELAEHYSIDQIIEVMQITGQYHTISYIAAGLALPLEDGAARFSEYEALL
ncbi:MAG: carboxymuconolactone decarboxylase family protein [Sphingomonadaceae bacterium]